VYRFGNFQIAIASSVKELVAKDFFQNKRKDFLALPPQDESLLQSLYRPTGRELAGCRFRYNRLLPSQQAMSTSQLYRKTISLTGLSPNILLKEFRLEKAKELMKKQRYTIAQITFVSGFTERFLFYQVF
jgi:AraC-like DNA-binding protein